MVLRMVIVTSVIVPFSLPMLVKLLAGARVSIPLSDMISLLAVVIFVPMGLVAVLRRYWPGLSGFIEERQFPLSLSLFTAINLGVFSKYSGFFFGNPYEIVRSTVLAYMLSAVYYLAGSWLNGRPDADYRLAAGISTVIVNNVLVLVFSSDSFGPLSPTLAAMYMFPFFTVIVMGNYWLNRKAGFASGKGGPV